MEEQSTALLATLKRPSAPVDAKVAQFNALKSSIKHLRVPDAAQANVLECVRIAIASSSPQLVALGFSSLGHLAKRLQLQDQSGVLLAQAPKLLPLYLERMGDAREAHRAAAVAALVDMWPLCREKVEVLVRETAMAGHNPRQKETAIKWVAKMHGTEGFLLKTFVAPMVAALEDADGIVRETAKNVLVELFRNASEKAKSDVKKQMAAHNVRKATVHFITAQLDGGRAPLEPAASDLKASTMSLPNFSTEPGPEAFGDSVSGEIPHPQEAVPMDPLYIHSQRDLEDAFREMQPAFEGKESEHNWIARDKNVTKIRRLTSGNAPNDFHIAFLLGIKGLIDGINKVANSLRTTMSSNGCACVQELAKTLGTSFDPMADFFLPGFMKMSGATKHIAASNGSATVDIIFANVTYHLRLMQQVWSASQEKNVQIRTFATSWLKTLLKKHGAKPHFETSLELVEKCLKKGLTDSNPRVKEASRSTYWMYAKLWPKKADAFLDTLEARTRGFVEKAPENPNASLASSVSSLATSAADRPLTAAAGRASVRDTIIAQRRAMKSAAVERPSSAASILSSAGRTGPAASLKPAVSTANMRTQSERNESSASTRSQTTAGAEKNTAGSLMSAPLRRPRRLEPARPATADPYHRNNNNKSARGLNLASPAESLEKGGTMRKTPGKTTRTPATRRNASPPRSKSHVEQLSGSTRAPTPSLEARGSSPLTREDARHGVTFTRPQVDHDDTVTSTSVSHQKRAGMDKTFSVDSGIAGISNSPVDDEGFTMVVPDLRPASIATAHHSPSKPSKIPSPQRATPRSVISERGSPAKSPMHPHINLSPLAQRQLFPRSPAQEPTPNDEVNVYEDPFVADSPRGAPRSASPAKPVLEELPLNCNEQRLMSDGSSSVSATSSNEQNNRPASGLSSPTRSPTKFANGDVTHDRAETLRSRRLLASGIERVRTRSLDAHGFRRLQDLLKHANADIWHVDSPAAAEPGASPAAAAPHTTRAINNRYAELIGALLAYMATPLDAATTPGAKAQNLKTQALATLRAMLTLWRKEGEPFLPAVLAAVVWARAEWDASSHMAAELERTADDVVRMCGGAGRVGEAVDALLAVVEAETVDARVASAALAALAALLRCAGGGAVESAAPRLGMVAVRFLADRDSDVRKADMDFCLELHERLGGVDAAPAAGGDDAPAGFWSTIKKGGLRPEQQNLITYYLARRAIA